jgi:hypothetical protein
MDLDLMDQIRGLDFMKVLDQSSRDIKKSSKHSSILRKIGSDQLFHLGEISWGEISDLINFR